jgi:bacillithiol biosynthesis cysteine-adding enzyme BshC
MNDIPRWIEFGELPSAAGGFSKLFLEYLKNAPGTRSFFRYHFLDAGGYQAVMDQVSAHQPDRKTLGQVLREQNSAFGSDQQTFENISLLEKPGTFAVVTGQQVGLFGGPLYTVFKTITTLKLARALKSRHPEKDFVPVFWVEGEDHDFAEMNGIAVPDADGKPVSVEYLPGGMMPERNLGAVGEVVFDSTLTQTLESLRAALQKTEYSDSLMQRLAECYAPGRTFNQAFVAWMNYLFKEQGLVFLSPNHPSLKEILSPIFVKELSEFPRVSQLVISQSAELEQNYHAQIKTKSINLFMFHKGGRYLIEPREHDFSLKGTRHFLSTDEMLRIARESPSLLSANVVLRPIAQDTLLPTVAYVAGPSEIAYHAQLRPVYEYFGTTQPIIYPRASASFLEEKVKRITEKYNVEVLDFFKDKDGITARVVEEISNVKLDQVFGDADRQIQDALHQLKFGLSEVDPTLVGALENVNQKIKTNVSVLKGKALDAQKRRNDTAVRQIEKTVNALLPAGVLQEREINVTYFLNKYGPEIIRWLMRELDVDAIKHQLLPM